MERRKKQLETLLGETKKSIANHHSGVEVLELEVRSFGIRHHCRTLKADQTAIRKRKSLKRGLISSTESLNGWRRSTKG